MPCVRRTSASERVTSECEAKRVRCSTVPVLPPTPTFPVFSTSNANSAVFSKFRNSCRLQYFVDWGPYAPEYTRDLETHVPFAPLDRQPSVTWSFDVDQQEATCAVREQ